MSIFRHRALGWAVCIAGLCAGQGQAAEPAKRPTKPGEQSSAPPTNSNGDTATTMAAAATAAMRDSDPALNGTVKEATSTPSAVAKR